MISQGSRRAHALKKVEGYLGPHFLQVLCMHHGPSRSLLGFIGVLSAATCPPAFLEMCGQRWWTGSHSHLLTLKRDEMLVYEEADVQEKQFIKLHNLALQAGKVGACNAPIAGARTSRVSSLLSQTSTAETRFCELTPPISHPNVTSRQACMQELSHPGYKTTWMAASSLLVRRIAELFGSLQ